ncbi:hypothetical protein Dimus_003843 [Dionaea muscipula]
MFFTNPTTKELEHDNNSSSCRHQEVFFFSSSFSFSPAHRCESFVEDLGHDDQFSRVSCQTMLSISLQRIKLGLIMTCRRMWREAVWPHRIYITCLSAACL